MKGAQKRESQRWKDFLVRLFQETLPDQPSTLVYMSSDPSPHYTSCERYNFSGWLGGLVPLVLGCVLPLKLSAPMFQGHCDEHSRGFMTYWLALFEYGRSAEAQILLGKQRIPQRKTTFPCLIKASLRAPSKLQSEAAWRQPEGAMTTLSPENSLSARQSASFILVGVLRQLRVPPSPISGLQ